MDEKAFAGGGSGAAALLGGCAACLGERVANHAVIPCGHLALCGACAGQAKRRYAKCPICRGPLGDLLRIYMPSSSKDEELNKALDRCRAAEERTRELEKCLRQRPTKYGRQGAPEVGSWVDLPTLNSRTKAPLLQQGDKQYSRQCGEIVSIGDTYTVRFQGIDEELYVAHGREQLGGASRNVDFPLAMQFQNVYTPEEAQNLGLASYRYCVFASVREARKRKLCADRREGQKRSKKAIVV